MEDGLDGIMQHVLTLWRRLRTNETKKVNASDRNIGEKLGRRSPMLTVSWEIWFQFVFEKLLRSNIGMNERDWRSQNNNACFQCIERQ